jgi:hypothetical protein
MPVRLAKAADQEERILEFLVFTDKMSRMLVQCTTGTGTEYSCASTTILSILPYSGILVLVLSSTVLYSWW